MTRTMTTSLPQGSHYGSSSMRLGENKPWSHIAGCSETTFEAGLEA